jgi:hypothetical protein
MTTIDFISSELFPSDDYIKEIVYICLEGKYRVAYVRKKAQNGGLFWTISTIGVNKDGKKEYFPAFIQDSNFLERDIKDFLEKRKWEEKPKSIYAPPKSQSEMPF